MRKNETVKTAGPLPLKMDCGRNPDMFVIVTNQGNHYATTYDPSAARLILAGPELLAAARNALNVLAALVIGDLKAIKTDSAAIAELRAAILRAEGSK